MGIQVTTKRPLRLVDGRPLLLSSTKRECRPNAHSGRSTTGLDNCETGLAPNATLILDVLTRTLVPHETTLQEFFRWFRPTYATAESRAHVDRIQEVAIRRALDVHQLCNVSIVDSLTLEDIPDGVITRLQHSLRVWIAYHTDVLFRSLQAHVADAPESRSALETAACYSMKLHSQTETDMYGLESTAVNRKVFSTHDLGSGKSLYRPKTYGKSR